MGFLSPLPTGLFGPTLFFPRSYEKENKTLALCFAERFFHEVMKGGFPKVGWRTKKYEGPTVKIWLFASLNAFPKVEWRTKKYEGGGF